MCVMELKYALKTTNSLFTFALVIHTDSYNFIIIMTLDLTFEIDHVF